MKVFEAAFRELSKNLWPYPSISDRVVRRLIGVGPDRSDPAQFKLKLE